MKILLLVLILIAVVIMFTKGSKSPEEAQWNKHQDQVVPRYHPVYLDAQTPYLNEQIMYNEWPQEISSSL